METLANNWFEIILFAGLTCFAMAAVIQIKYYLDLRNLSRRTDKYKLASAEESRKLREASYYFSVGIGFLLFYVVSQWMGKDIPRYHYLFISFFAVIIAYAVGYSCWVILKYYYPFILEKRLNNIRFKPMYSPTDGRPLTLLTENEEDVHMTKEMLEEENTFSADYDVWLNEITGEKVIEKYDTHYHRQVCEECNFRTLKDIKETVIVEPSNEKEGLLEKEYKCSYCGHMQTVQAHIPSWLEESTMA